MTSYVENETDVEFPFDAQEVLEKIMVMSCPPRP